MRHTMLSSKLAPCLEFVKYSCWKQCFAIASMKGIGSRLKKLFLSDLVFRCSMDRSKSSAISSNNDVEGSAG